MTKQQKNELSVIVQLSDSSVIGLKSDLSKLNDYQSIRLREFIHSVVTEPPKPKELIRELNSYPYVKALAYSLRAYPVNANRNYGGL